LEKMRAACIQFSPEPMNPEKNLMRAYQYLKECEVLCNPDLVVFPETFTTGFTPFGGDKALFEVVEKIPGPATSLGEQWAKEMNCFICFPVYERGKGLSTIYNSAALIGPSGILGVYRKTHPFPTERTSAGGWTTPGNESFCIETPKAKIGIVICYDGDFPELARVTALKGAEVICRPSAFMRAFDQWDLTNRARAYDNHVYWVATNCTGVDASGAAFFGSSMIVHPSGQKLSQASGRDEIIWADLDPNPIRSINPGSSIEQIFDHIEDRNLKAYNGLLEEGHASFEPSKRIPYER